MGISVRIVGTLDGERIISRSLRALEARIDDISPAFPELIRIARGFMRQAIDSEGASTDAGKWAPLTARTQAERKRQGYGPAHPMLRRSNRLYRSVTGDGDGAFTVETPRYLAIGSNDPKIVFHQSLRPRTRLPRRAVASFTADQKNELMRPIRLYVTGFAPDTPQRTRPFTRERAL